MSVWVVLEDNTKLHVLIIVSVEEAGSDITWLVTRNCAAVAGVLPGARQFRLILGVLVDEMVERLCELEAALH